MRARCGLFFGLSLVTALSVACGGDGEKPPPNADPSAVFTASTTSGPAPLQVDFDASGSGDADGTIVDYTWSFGDGRTASGVTTSITYANAGLYTATLTVTDDDGATDSATLDIEVGGAGVSIGPAGGTAVSDDGRVSVVIPAGALASTETISVTRLVATPGGALSDHAYEFQPSGLVFEMPITLRMQYDSGGLPVGLDEEGLTLGMLASGVFWHEVVGATVDAANDTLIGTVSHFSTYGLLVGRFGAEISGEQEVPPTASVASGTAIFSIDTGRNLLTHHVEFRDLGGSESAAAIHGPAVRGATAPVLHVLSLGSPKSGTWAYDESIEADLLAGRTYVSIRSSAFPTGELRGQIEPLGPSGSIASLTVRVALWDDLSGAWANNTLPPAVARLQLQVSGADIATQTQDISFTAPPIEQLVSVSKGLARRVEVQAFDSSDQVIFRAAAMTDLDHDEHTLDVTMWGAGDVSAPSFGGLTAATGLSGDAIALEWDAATDDTANAAEITYLVYMATSAGGQDFSSALYASSPGENGYTTRGLAAGTNYHFVVRAMDPGGNLDANQSEVLATTWATGAGLHVDAGAGLDTPVCGGSLAPCKSITQALDLTGGNEPIYVARGVYDSAATGESFPLRLLPGTRLYGALAFVQLSPTSPTGALRGTLVPTAVVRSALADSVVIGAAGAHVGGLFIEESKASNVATIDADDHAISIAWCVLEGPGSTSVTNAIQLGAGTSVRRTVVRDFGYRGIRGFGDGMVISHNRIVRSGGAISVQGGDWIISHNGVRDNAFFGVLASSIDAAPGGLILRNALRDNDSGVEISNVYGSEIVFNSITGNGVGIQLAGAAEIEPVSTLIGGNYVGENELGILLWTKVNPVVRGNDISCNDYVDLGSWGSEQIDARHNSWDHAPPTLFRNAGSNLDGCMPEGVDVCTAGTYAGTPDPLLDPAAGPSSCGSSTVGQLP